MRNEFLTVNQAAALIHEGKVMLIAGAPGVLAGLPRGRWIGGSTPYFMTPSGGVKDRGHLFCTIIDEAADVRIESLGPDELPGLIQNRFENGFSYVLVPAFSAVHQRFALEVPALEGLYNQPVLGWVTGMDLDELGKTAPLAVDGRTGDAHTDKAVVMRLALPAAQQAELDIINLFTQGEGDEISFPATGFTASECLINGQPGNFAAYLREKQADPALPLVSDYAGAMINVSFRAVDDEQVEFYAPVVAGRRYRLAAPVGEYGAAYSRHCGAQAGGAALSFNCILNYLYAALEGKMTAGFIGPVTFGEIAYILLNQTLVRLDLVSVPALAGA
ncbi:DUF6976 family protein [Acidocella sp.]|uniref:DUF6976 family protein n=1 Tax=Acidocella sp. TaxID=50710 RepID=UPI0026111386|nr:hypothetical protein [Acidocella sp.]